MAAKTNAYNMFIRQYLIGVATVRRLKLTASVVDVTMLSPPLTVEERAWTEAIQQWCWKSWYKGLHPVQTSSLVVKCM